MHCEQSVKKSKPLYFGRGELGGNPISVKGQSGAVLVLTLLIIAVLAVVAVAFMQNTTSERFIARSQSNFYRGQLAAEAGLAAATGALIRGTTNDHFVVVLNHINRQLYVGTGQASGTDYNYIPLFSATTNITNAAFGLANTNLPTTNVSAGTGFTAQLPGGITVASPDISWVYLTNSSGQTNARFAYWVEDLAGRLDLSVVGATGAEARRPTGTNPGEIALWSLFTNAASDLLSTNVASLLTARSNLFTAASARVVAPNVTASVLADLAAGLIHDTNEPQVIPNGFGYAQQGQPKVNINANLTAAGATNIISHIQANLPLFASTNRSGGMSNTTYMNYLAANIVDYADADSTPTVVGGEAGNEPMPWLNEIWDHYRWQGWPGTPPAVTNADGSITINVTVVSYAEFWNMTDKAFTGDLSFVQNQTNRYVVMGDLATGPSEPLATNPWTFFTNNITFTNNEYKVLIVASNQISLNWGTQSLTNNAMIYPQNSNNSHLTYSLSWNGVEIDAIINPIVGPRKLLGANARVSRTGSAGFMNLWVGSAFISPPNNNATNGLFGDPRINRYINQGPINISGATRLQGNNIGNSSFGGRNTNAGAIGTFDQLRNWPDGSYVTRSPLGYQGMSAGNTPFTPSVAVAISNLYYSNAPIHFNNSGAFTNVCELGNIFDPLQWVVNGASGSGVITNGATPSRNAGGGQSLRVGRAEHPRFAITTSTPPKFTSGLRASQLLDIFEVGPATAAVVSNVSAGRININTASTNVLRALAAGVFHSSDPVLTPGGTNFVVPTTAVDAFVTGVTNYRSRQPFFAPSQLTLIATNTNLSEWPTNAVFGNSAIAGVTEWSDAASEEWFSKIYPLSTVRSRNFLVCVVGQAVSTNAPTRVESEARQVFQVYMEPVRGGANGLTTNSFPVVIRSWSL
jgi:hypothetical protein